MDIRLVCATNSNLEELVGKGLFREDLYYRINTLHLHLPALRERSGDIIPLAEIFMKQFSEKYHREASGISEEGKEALQAYDWPGNIRELQNCIEKAVILSEGAVLGPEELQVPRRSGTMVREKPLETLEEAEEKAIRSAVARYSGNLSLVAKALDISRPTLYNKLKKYGI